MSQRTRIRTTAAAAPPPSEPPSMSPSVPASSSPKRRTRGDAPGSATHSHEAGAARSVAPASPPAGETHAKRHGSPAKRSDTSTVKEDHGLGLGGLGPEHLARALRAVASELERDPALAQRVSAAVYSPTESPQHDQHAERNAQLPGEEPSKKAPKRGGRAFTPRVVEGVSATLGTGILDPFAVRATSGEEGLRTVLAELRLGSLRAIAREHRLDPSGTAVRGNDAEKLRALILEESVTRTRS